MVAIHQRVVALDVQGHQGLLPLVNILAEDNTGIAVAGTGNRLHYLGKLHPRHTGGKDLADLILIRIDKIRLFDGLCLAALDILVSTSQLQKV